MNILFNKSSLLGAVILSFLLTGCFGSSNSSNNTDNGGNTTQTSVSTALALQSAESEPASLNAVAAVKNDLTALFGSPDSQPVALQKGETLQSVFEKASQ